MKTNRASGQRLPSEDQTHYANEAEVAPADRAVLETPGGRADNAGVDRGSSGIFEAEVASIPVGARPMSEITAHHDAGSANETIDGLDETEEAVRAAAEDIPPGRRRP